MSSITVPYYINPKELPCRLPTNEEIESSEDILSDQTARTVAGVGSHFVVKYGISIDPNKGKNMLFVRQNTSVAAPRLYAIYTNTLNRKNCHEENFRRQARLFIAADEQSRESGPLGKTP